MADANTHASISRQATLICRSMGLKHTIYASPSIRDRPEDDPLLLTSFPKAWVDRYLNNRYQEIDPALLLAATSVLPVNWDKISRRSARVRKFFNEAKALGVGNHGITISVFGPNGNSGLFSVTAEMPDCQWKREYPRLERDITYLSHLVHERVAALSDRANSTKMQDISLMEKSCLQWVADGHTMLAVAQKLNVSERAVRMYLSTARSKLDAKNTTHAIAIMMRCGQLI